MFQSGSFPKHLYRLLPQVPRLELALRLHNNAIINSFSTNVPLPISPENLRKYGFRSGTMDENRLNKCKQNHFMGDYSLLS